MPAVQEALATGGSYSVDLRAFRGDRPIWVTARATAVRHGDGRVIGLRGTVQDITERKHIEEALREADVRKDEFLATLAHELRNPLAPLRNGLAILRSAENHTAAAVRARELMDRQLSHLVRLVDDLLDVSRVSQGKVRMQKSITSLQAVVDLALETCRPLMDDAGHQLEVQLPPSPSCSTSMRPGSRRCSEPAEQRGKVHPSRGSILLSAHLLDLRLQVRVKDNGIGIPPECSTRCSTCSPRSGCARSRARRPGDRPFPGPPPGGTPRRQHAGFQSRFEAGKHVRVRVAGGRAAGTCNHRAPGVSEVGAGKRVLVVDDNKDAAETLGCCWKSRDTRWSWRTRAQRRWKLRRGGRPQIIFLDIGLPDLNGYQVAGGYGRIRNCGESAWWR